MKRLAISLMLLGALQVTAFAEKKVRVTSPNGETIHTGEVLRISSKPAMPQFKAKLTNGNGDIGWVLKSKYEYRSEDSQRLPSKGTDSVPADKYWVPHIQSSRGFFGGKITIEGKEGSRTYETSFKIYGRNPKDSDAKRYIKSRPGSPWFAWGIAQHESRQGDRVYNQFNTTKSKLYEPVRNGNEWGMFQIRKADTEETWNWKDNVKAGVKELQHTKQEAQAYFNAIRRNFPLQYENPPKYRPPGTDTTLTAIEAAQMQLYDEPSITLILPNSQGKAETYHSCWAFNPLALPGFRWTFIPNKNNYVQKVVANEIDGGLPTKE